MPRRHSYPLIRWWGRSVLVGCAVLVSGAAVGQRDASSPAQQAFRADVSKVQVDVIVRADRGFVARRTLAPSCRRSTRTHPDTTCSPTSRRGSSPMVPTTTFAWRSIDPACGSGSAPATVTSPPPSDSNAPMRLLGSSPGWRHRRQRMLSMAPLPAPNALRRLRWQGTEFQCHCQPMPCGSLEAGCGGTRRGRASRGARDWSTSPPWVSPSRSGSASWTAKGRF